ncbi:hypothetical protein ABK040_004259 [Willaertia magna]
MASSPSLSYSKVSNNNGNINGTISIDNNNAQPRFLMDSENACYDPLFIYFPNYFAFSNGNEIVNYFNAHYFIKIYTEPSLSNNEAAICNILQLSDTPSKTTNTINYCGIHVKNVQQLKWDNNRKTKYAAIIDRSTNQIVGNSVKFKSRNTDKSKAPIFPNNMSNGNFISIGIASTEKKENELIDFHYNNTNNNNTPLTPTSTTSSSSSTRSKKSVTSVTSTNSNNNTNVVMNSGGVINNGNNNVNSNFIGNENFLERNDNVSLNNLFSELMNNNELMNGGNNIINNNVTNQMNYPLYNNNTLYNNNISPLLQPLHQRVSPQKEYLQQQFNYEHLNNISNNYTSILPTSSSSSSQQHYSNFTPTTNTPNSCDNYNELLDSVSSFGINNIEHNIENNNLINNFDYFNDSNSENNDETVKINKTNYCNNNNNKNESEKRTRGVGDDNYSSSSSLLSNKQHEKKNLKEDIIKEEQEIFEKEIELSHFLELFKDFKFKLENNLYDLIDKNYKKECLLKGVTICNNLLKDDSKTVLLEDKINQMNELELQYSLFGVVFVFISLFNSSPIRSILRSFKEDFLKSFNYSNKKMILQFKQLIGAWLYQQLNNNNNSKLYSLVFVNFVKNEMNIDFSNNNLMIDKRDNFRDLLLDYLQKSKDKSFNNDLNNNEMEEANNLLKRLTLDDSNVTEKELQQFEKLTIDYLKTKSHLQKYLK